MAKYNVLKSIAHNLEHSYLSLMNYVDGDYVVERIFHIAKAQKIPLVMIDVLAREIQPEPFATEPLKMSLGDLNRHLAHLLSSENMTLADIQSAIIRITFDLDNIKRSERVPSLELPSYECISEFVDANGKVHSKSVVEWWRY